MNKKQLTIYLRALQRLVVCTFFCIIGISNANAVSSEKYSLVVTLNDGTTQTFQLNSRPSIGFQEDQFVISQAESDIEFSVANVTGFSFTDKGSSSIKAVNADNLIISYTDHQHILVYGAKDEAEVRVSNLEGVLQPCSISRQNGSILSISLENLQHGVYIVSIGNRQNFKIVRK